MTLDPNKFVEKNQQPFCIGNQQSFTPFITLNKQSSPVKKIPLTYEIFRELYLAYPPETKSFLYYFTSPDKPRIAAELRLRVISSPAASFESGSDLLTSNGQPWSRPLCLLPRFYNYLYEKLVPDDLDAVLSTYTPISPKYRRNQFLYTLNDTFIVDFSCYLQFFHVITEQGMERVRIMGLFSERREDLLAMPYTGTFTNHHLLILLD
jgi:hypothetical protein